MKIAIVTASLGGFDEVVKPVDQSIPFDFYSFTDDNFPPRKHSMAPRLQAKIPKMFAWQLIPKYDYYLWLDGSITLKDKDQLKFFYDNIQGYDAVFMKHYSRPNIRQEDRYTRKGVNQKAYNLHTRYDGEWFAQIYKIVRYDPEYVDDLLLMGGMFMYRNTPKMQEALKEWWYYVTRYAVQDQISLPYVLRKCGVNFKVIDDDFKKYTNWTGKKHNYKGEQSKW